MSRAREKDVGRSVSKFRANAEGVTGTRFLQQEDLVVKTSNVPDSLVRDVNAFGKDKEILADGEARSCIDLLERLDAGLGVFSSRKW
jgi:hypothetical protein